MINHQFNFGAYPPPSYIPANVGSTIHIDGENVYGIVVARGSDIYRLRLRSGQQVDLPFTKRHTITRRVEA